MFFKRGKRGEIEWELGKIILAVVLLAILIVGVVVLLKGKGGEVLGWVKNLFRFGRAG